jgi:hypothetical protein
MLVIKPRPVMTTRLFVSIEFANGEKPDSMLRIAAETSARF